jgi:hypothetical protein
MVFSIRLSYFFLILFTEKVRCEPLYRRGGLLVKNAWPGLFHPIFLLMSFGSIFSILNLLLWSGTTTTDRILCSHEEYIKNSLLFSYVTKRDRSFVYTTMEEYIYQLADKSLLKRVPEKNGFQRAEIF